MNSFEMNKVLGAVLGTCLGVVAINIAAGAVFAPGKLAKPGYEIKVPEKSPQTPGDTTEPEQPIGQYLAMADVSRGENAAKKCAACHTFQKGEPPRVGPNLWGGVGRPKAGEVGFNYSAALKGKGGNWTVEDLFQFLANPKAMVPGTSMTFAGAPRG